MVFDFDTETSNGLVIDVDTLLFSQPEHPSVMFSLYREAAEASVDLFSVSNRDEISGNRFALTRPT